MTPSPNEALSKFPLVATDCVEEAESILSRSLTTCRIKKVSDRGRFGMQMNGLNLGCVSLVHNRYQADSTIESELPGDPVFFNIGIRKPSTFRSRNRSWVSHSQNPVLLTDSNRMEIDRPDNSAVFVLRVWKADLEQHLEALTNRHHRGRLVFRQDANLRGDMGGSLARLMWFLADELDRDPALATNPLFQRSYESILLSHLLGLPHNRSESLLEDRPHEISPGIVNKAQEYIRAHFSEAVTVSDLLRICECSRSTLFSAFRNAKGYTPKEFLTEQRLESVRRELLQPKETTSVTSAAFDAGFVHLGRFARAYQKRFGERPSDTLKRAQGVA